MRSRELDSIDCGILNRIAQHPGISVLEAIRPFLNQRSETVLRQRVRQMGIEKRIRYERTRYELRCFPADASDGDAGD